MFIILFYIFALAMGVVLSVAYWSIHRVPSLSLSNTCVLLTGGSTGIGLEIARQLTHRGVKVMAITARREDVLTAAAQTLQQDAPPNTRVLHTVMDVSDADSVARGVSTLTQQMNGAHFDLVVCNAGLAIPARFLDTTPAEGRYMMDVNFFGCVHLARAVLPEMLRRRKGRLVFVSSMAARAPIAGYSFYAASKAAVRAFAHSLDMENSPFGVRCQVVSPPDVETPGLASENTRKSPECAAISSFGGAVAFDAQTMGRRVVEDVLRYRFDVCLGSDGVLLGWGAAGMEPATSLVELLAQVMLSGWLRLGFAVYSKIHYGIVQRIRRNEGTEKEERNKKST